MKVNSTCEWFRDWNRLPCKISYNKNEIGPSISIQNNCFTGKYKAAFKIFLTQSYMGQKKDLFILIHVLSISMVWRFIFFTLFLEILLADINNVEQWTTLRELHFMYQISFTEFRRCRNITTLTLNFISFAHRCFFIFFK